MYQQQQQNPMLVSMLRPPLQALSFLPNIGPMPPQFNEVYPIIVNACLGVVQAGAQRSMLRTLLYNQMSENGYNNNEFTSLVGFCVKVIDYTIRSGNNQNINQLITNVVEKAVAQFAALNVVKDSSLQSILNPQTMASAMTLVREHNGLVANMSGNNGQQQMWSQPQQPQQFGFNQPNPQQQAFMMQQQQQQMWSQPPQQFNTPFNPQGWSPTPSSPFSLNQVNSPAQDRYSTNNFTPSNVTPIFNQQPQQGALTPESKYQESFSHAANTRAGINSATEKNPLLVQPLAYDCTLFKDVGTLGNQELVKIQGSEMDKQRHVSTVVAPVIAVIGENNNTTLERNLTQPAPEAKLNLVRKRRDHNNADMDLVSAVAEARINLTVMPKDPNASNLFRVSGMIYTPYPSMKDFKSLVESLHYADTFCQAQSILKSEKSKIENADPAANCDNTSLTNLNIRLTAAVNNYLKNKLIVEYGWMDSFIEDVNELIEFIENKYGPDIRDKLIRDQKMIISSATISFNGDIASIIEEQELNELLPQPTDRPNIVCLADPYILTSIDLFASELNLVLPDTELGCVVTKEHAPLFWKIADNSLNEKENRIKPDDSGVELELNHRHLIVTLDNKIFEVNRGAISSEAYVVSRYRFTLN